MLIRKITQSAGRRKLTLSRNIFSKTGLWPITCTFNYEVDCVVGYLKEVESYWKPILDRKFKDEYKNGDKERYILSMFPYPSGSLHLGHVRIYTSADVTTRFSRLKGHKVVNPMGWDSFGLPAENAAIKHNLDPADWTYSNISFMKKQLDSLGLHFNWREATSDPSFYKWTQWLFVKLFKAGLVYKSRGKVNWDPVDCTVLADEQIDSEGKSWRSGAVVEKKYLRQWFIKTNSLIDDLYIGKDVDLTEKGIHWRHILNVQRKWFGEPNGYLFYMNLDEDIVPVFTDKPEYFLNKNSILQFHKNHWLSQTNIRYIQNPFNGEDLEVRFVEKQDIQDVFREKAAGKLMCYEDSNGEGLNAKLRKEVLNIVKEKPNLGGYWTSSNYNDWLISRQRYWGTPIPVVYCKDCGYKPVKEDDLPVILPKLGINNQDKNSKKIGIGEIASEDWLLTDCPECKKPGAKRETDTCDTFFDSSWYYLRYASEPSSIEPYLVKSVQDPVWLYIGGEEHAIGHLFYARFIHHFLNNQGLLGECSSKEPFRSILLQGMVKGKTYRLMKNKKYLKEDEAHKLLSDGIIKESDLEVRNEKMSKSKGNGVDPSYLIDKYGIDFTRLCVLGKLSPKSERIWTGDKNEYQTLLKLLRRIILTIDQFIYIKLIEKERKDGPVVRRYVLKNDDSDIASKLQNLRCAKNEIILNGTIGQEKLFNAGRLNDLILAFMDKELRQVVLNPTIVNSKEYEDCLATMIIMMSPLIPHLSQECWAGFRYYSTNIKEELVEYVIDSKLQQVDDSHPRYLVINCKGMSSMKIPIEKEKIREENYDYLKNLVMEHFPDFISLDLNIIDDLQVQAFVTKDVEVKRMKKKKKVKKAADIAQ